MLSLVNHIAGLIGKHLDGTISEMERTELIAWTEESEANLTFFKQFENDQYLMQELEKMYNYDIHVNWNKLIALAKIIDNNGKQIQTMQF